MDPETNDTNRYAPPVAEVVDAPAPSIGKPRQIVWAVRLLWASITVAIVSALSTFVGLEDSLRELTVSFFIFSFTFQSMLGWLTYGVSRGRNWARFVVLFFTVVGVGLFVYVISPDSDLGTSVFRETQFSWYVFRKLLAVVESILQITATLLLFTESARRWFALRAKKSAPSPAP